MTASIREDGRRIDLVDLESSPENVDFVGPRFANASRFVRSVVDRAAEARDDLAVALLIRVRGERGDEPRIPLDAFLEDQGFDVAQLEAELDAEDG